MGDGGWVHGVFSGDGGSRWHIIGCLSVLDSQNLGSEQLDTVEPLAMDLVTATVAKLAAVNAANVPHHNPMHSIKNPLCSGFFALNETLKAATGKGELWNDYSSLWMGKKLAAGSITVQHSDFECRRKLGHNLNELRGSKISIPKSPPPRRRLSPTWFIRRRRCSWFLQAWPRGR